MQITICQLVNVRAPLLLLCLAAWAVGGAPEASKDARGIEDPVSLYVTVEKDGGLIQGLGERNFQLFVDGDHVPAELREPEEPASIALLVEYSESSWYYFRDIIQSMQGFIESAPEGHWYALASFAHDFRIEVDFTKRRGKIANGFEDMTPPMWEEVNTYDALYRMLDKMGRLGGRRILIFIGSGFDTLSSRTLEDVQEKLESVNVVVYAIGAGSALRGANEMYLSTSQRMNVLQADAFLRMLADKSGGQAWFPRFESAFPDVMEGIMQCISNQYKLVYSKQAPSDGEFHEIEVKAFVVRNDQRTDFEVRVREGWRRGL